MRFNFSLRSLSALLLIGCISLSWSTANNAQSIHWHQQGAITAPASALLQRMMNAANDGLRPQDYDADNLSAMASQLAAQPGEEAWRNFDAQMTTAATRFIHHLHYGRIPPRAAGFNLQSERRDLDVDGTLNALATATATPTTINVILASIEPKFQHYSLLKKTLLRYRELAKQPQLVQLPTLLTKKVSVNDKYSGAAALATLLHAEGDLPQLSEAQDTLTSTLSEALARYQRRHGLTADGTLGARTFQELTTPFSRRVQQIELTMERWRWVPPLSSPSVIVNIPQFRLFAFATAADREQDMLRMDVIVGKAIARKRTPVFMAQMKFVVFRPYWDIPRDIALNEILSKARDDAAYLQQHHYELVRGQSDNSPVVDATPENIQLVTTGAVRLRQQPGPDNPLGNVKFMLPNDYSVYLHGTPEHHLFDASQRTFSHGCIRLSNPQALAEFVLNNNADGPNANEVWSSDSIAAAMQGEPNQRVYLKQPITVMILYGTAVAAESGLVYFFNDVYGYDRKLLALLNR